MMGTKPMARPWAPLRTAIGAGMPKTRTAMRPEAASEMSAHQWVLTLKTPMRTKKAIRGSRPTAAVRRTLPPTAVVDGVKEAPGGARGGQRAGGGGGGVMWVSKIGMRRAMAYVSTANHRIFRRARPGGDVPGPAPGPGRPGRLR